MRRIVRSLFALVLVSAYVGCDGPTEPKSQVSAHSVSTQDVKSDKVEREEELLEICQYSERKLGDSILVRLERSHLKAYGLSRRDVMGALAPSTLHYEEPPYPTAGTIYVHELCRIDTYPEIIIRCNPEGQIVRLKDVATIELKSVARTQKGP